MGRHMASDNSAQSLRGGVFAALAAYVLISPVFPQMLGSDFGFIRPWIMFRDVGVGVLKGEFVFTTRSGATERLTPLEILGADRYPVRRQPYRFDGLVFSDADIARFAAPFCAARAAEGADLRFEGRVGAGASGRAASVGGLFEAPR